jgi:hypothetical protein
MRTPNVTKRLATAGGHALVGGICGALLAAFGSAISSTPSAMVATITVTAIVAGSLGRFTGVICGIVGGVLLVAFGSVVGGSAVAAALTILVCALLAGVVSWHHDVYLESGSIRAKCNEDLANCIQLQPPRDYGMGPNGHRHRALRNPARRGTMSAI